MGRIEMALKEATLWLEICSNHFGSNAESTRLALEIIKNCHDTNVGEGIRSTETLIRNLDRTSDEYKPDLLRLVTNEIGDSKMFPENVEDILLALQILLDVTRELLAQLDGIIGNVYDLFYRITEAMNAAYKNGDPLTQWKNLLRNSLFAYNERMEKLDEEKPELPAERRKEFVENGATNSFKDIFS
ncbi:hypothetical protein B566_EDAN012644 [Ephemera danica]|nr:hypothetical protein B566_EDAN012644 [Ephemera danica]